MIEIKEEDVEKTFKKLDNDAEKSGYHLNPDEEFTKSLVKSLLINQQRYGYWACPCRLASGDKSDDIDIICPCDYRDADLSDFGSCFCALYVSDDIKKGKRKAEPIPERRPSKKKRDEMKNNKSNYRFDSSNLSKPVWRCKVCGYLCANDNPPGICPICKAKKERFEEFM